MQRLFPRSIDALAMIAHFVDEFIAANRLGQGASFSVNLVIEELFTNMVKYSSGGAEEISVQLESRDDRIVLQMIDYDVEEFDMNQAPVVDPTLPMRDRTGGGLGIHLVRSFAEKIDYSYSAGNSTITVVLNPASEES